MFILNTCRFQSDQIAFNAQIGNWKVCCIWILIFFITFYFPHFDLHCKSPIKCKWLIGNWKHFDFDLLKNIIWNLQNQICIYITNIENWVGVRKEEISCNTLYSVVHQIGYYYVSIFHSEIKLKASLESYFLFSVFCPQKSLKLDQTRPTGLFRDSRDSPDLKSQTTTE